MKRGLPYSVITNKLEYGAIEWCNTNIGKKMGCL